MVLGGIVYLAVLPTLVTFFLTQYTTLRLGPTRVQAYGYALPAIVLLLDLALGKPAPPLMTVPGPCHRAAGEPRGAARRDPRVPDLRP